jgi:hypothetical protein
MSLPSGRCRCAVCFRTPVTVCAMICARNTFPATSLTRLLPDILPIANAATDAPN